MSEQVAPPFPQQPGQPEPAYPAQPPAEAKKSRGRKILSIIGLLLAVVAVGLAKGGLRLWEQRNDTVQAKAGDCIGKLPEVVEGKDTKANGAKVVECTSTEAAYTVVGRVDGLTEAQAQAGEACDEYIKEGEDGYVFWGNERSGNKYYLLCLTKKA
ncbi:hypothetical protein [Micromonospora sp. SL4-19]|uniref:LppU/SCO3897 family protein n=1 Tax=Micromonospora sp. SL4-19 TaxID=3399129 RepID=UPI003A4D6F33